MNLTLRNIGKRTFNNFIKEWNASPDNIDLIKMKNDRYSTKYYMCNSITATLIDFGHIGWSDNVTGDVFLYINRYRKTLTLSFITNGNLFGSHEKMESLKKAIRNKFKDQII